MIHVRAPRGRDTCHLGRYINQCTFTLPLRLKRCKIRPQLTGNHIRPFYWSQNCWHCCGTKCSGHGTCCNVQGDHLSGKPGNAREFQSCRENFREKILSGKSCLKLFIVSCISASIHVFSTSVSMIWVTFNMPSAEEECRKLSGNFILSGEQSPWIWLTFPPSVHKKKI